VQCPILQIFSHYSQSDETSATSVISVYSISVTRFRSQYNSINESDHCDKLFINAASYKFQTFDIVARFIGVVNYAA